MSDKPCPGCNGRQQLKLTHVKYAPGYKGPPITEMPCIVCDGKGTITDVRERRMERGAKFHNYRVDVLQLGLREAAELWGMKPTELSYIEQGRVETDWVPPGYVEGKIAEPKSGESIPISDLRNAIAPVIDWFDIDGEEGEPMPLIEVITEIANMLSEERQDTLRYRQALQDIIKHQEIVAGPSMAPMSMTIRIARKALQEEGKPDLRQFRAMTLQFKPELTHSVWVDTYLSDENDCQLPKDQLIERLKQGVRDGEWVAWRLIHIEQEVMGNAD